MAHVISAVEQEYRKMGRLVLEREFGHMATDGRIVRTGPLPVRAFGEAVFDVIEQQGERTI